MFVLFSFKKLEADVPTQWETFSEDLQPSTAGETGYQKIRRVLATYKTRFVCVFQIKVHCKC